MESGIGTTTFGFKVGDGTVLEAIVHGVESRVTLVKTITTDKEDKHFHISSNLCCSFSGSLYFWPNMLTDVTNKVQEKERELGTLTTVSFASETIEKHLKQFENDEKHKTVKVGALITGWGESEGCEVHTVMLYNGRVHRETEKDFGAQGSGSMIAFRTLIHSNHINFSVEDGAKFGLKLLFDITYLDQGSGGTSYVYQMSKHGCKKIYEYEPLDLHVQLYNYCTRNECTLIVLSPEANLSIHTEDVKLIPACFHLDTAHLVAKIPGFSVHRLVFRNPQKASEMYLASKMKTPKNHKVPPNLPAQDKFHTVMLFDGLLRSTYPVYVAECSLDLLKLLASLAKKSSDVKTPKKKDSDVEMVDAQSKSEKKAPKTPATPETSGSKTLFAGNLSFSIAQNDVEEFFKNVGQVVDVRFSSDAEGNFGGYGHVEFATAEEAQKALDLNGSDLCGCPVRLDLARERGSYTPHSGKEGNSYQKGGQGQSQTIFVGGFDTTQGEDEIRGALQSHFGSCGEITRVSIPKDFDTGALEGMAYMDFSDADALDKAFELNGTDLGNGCSLTVQPAKPKGDFSGIRGGGQFDSGSHRGGRDSGGRRGGRGGRGPSQATTPGTGKKTTFNDEE